MKSVFQMIVLMSLISMVEVVNGQLLKWSWSQIDSIHQTSHKPIAVFIHTDWCKFCQAMKNTTFKDHKIIDLLNSHFIFVELNGEEKDDILFAGRTFSYRPSGYQTGMHELVAYLTKQMDGVNYPTFCILNGSNEVIVQYNYLLTAETLLSILHHTINGTHDRGAKDE